MDQDQDHEPTSDVLRDDIARVLNRHSRENRSDTPDFLLAEFMLDALDAFDRVVRMRESWYGRGDGGGIAPSPAPSDERYYPPLRAAPEEALLAPDVGEPLARQEYPRPTSLGIVEDRTPEQLAADGDQPTGEPDADRG